MTHYLLKIISLSNIIIESEKKKTSKDLKKKENIIRVVHGLLFW